MSACLLGAEVRFDGGHKRDRYVTDVLGTHVEWRPVCPELEAGLGLPRPAITLVGGERGDRLIVSRDGSDVTDQMARYAGPRVAELLGEGLDGFVFKKDSPSCGVFRGKVRPSEQGQPVRKCVPSSTPPGNMPNMIQMLMTARKVPSKPTMAKLIVSPTDL